MGSQNYKNPNFGKKIGFSLGSPETKCHLGVDPMVKHIVYYKGEGGAFPQVETVVSFVNPSLHVACFSTKSVPANALTNLFGLRMFMWVIDYLSFFLISSWSSNMPLYPKVLRARERAPPPYSFVVFTLDSHLSLLKSLGACRRLRKVERLR